MLNAILNIKKNVDVSKFMKLRAFLKKQNVGYLPKKSRIFNTRSLNEWMSEWMNEQFLIVWTQSWINILQVRKHLFWAIFFKNRNDNLWLFVNILLVFYLVSLVERLLVRLPGSQNLKVNTEVSVCSTSRNHSKSVKILIQHFREPLHFKFTLYVCFRSRENRLGRFP